MREFNIQLKPEKVTFWPLLIVTQSSSTPPQTSPCHETLFYVQQFLLTLLSKLCCKRNVKGNHSRETRVSSYIFPTLNLLERLMLTLTKAHFSFPNCPASKCDFENGSCGWRDLAPGDGFDWVRGRPAEVPAHYFGNPPPWDHSTNSSEGAVAHVGCF